MEQFKSTFTDNSQKTGAGEGGYQLQGVGGIQQKKTLGKQITIPMSELSSLVRYRDSKSLDTIFRRVFPHHSGSFFSLEEQIKLGSLTLESPIVGRYNTGVVAQLSLDYIRTIRSAASQHCDRIKTTEYFRFKEDNFQSSNLRQFVEKALGYNPGIDEFINSNIEAFEELKQSVRSTNYFQKNPGHYDNQIRLHGLIHVCTALITHPAIFTY